MESTKIKNSYKKTVPIKDNKHIKLHIDETIVKQDNDVRSILYDIYAVLGYGKPTKSFLDSSDTIGFALLGISMSEHEALLRNIKIINQDYLSCGIGSALLKEVENLCRKNGVTRIEGLFRPDTNNRIRREDVEKFYKKHGYFIYFDDERDNGWTIAKNLEPLPTPTEEENSII